MLRLSKSRAYLVPVVLRALDILEFLYKNGSPRKMNEIADTVGVPRTTTYRILRTLVHRGYITQDIHGRFCCEHTESSKIVPIRLQSQRSVSDGKTDTDSDLPSEDVVDLAIALLQQVRHGKQKRPSRK